MSNGLTALLTIVGTLAVCMIVIFAITRSQRQSARERADGDAAGSTGPVLHHHDGDGSHASGFGDGGGDGGGGGGE